MTDRYNFSTLLDILSVVSGTYLLADLKMGGVINLPWLVIFTPALVCLSLSLIVFLLFLYVVQKPFPFT
jgi:hypothetical protein